MTANQLLRACNDRKAIVGFHTFRSRIPAAFIVSMPFRIVMNRLPVMRIYKSKQKKK